MHWKNIEIFWRHVISGIRSASYFSISVDESVDNTGISQLLIFAKVVGNDFFVHENLLTCTPMHGTTMEKDIFDAVNFIFEKLNLDFGKLASVCTDCAPAIVSRNIGLIGDI